MRVFIVHPLHSWAFSSSTPSIHAPFHSHHSCAFSPSTPSIHVPFQPTPHSCAFHLPPPPFMRLFILNVLHSCAFSSFTASIHATFHFCTPSIRAPFHPPSLDNPKSSNSPRASLRFFFQTPSDLLKQNRTSLASPSRITGTST